MSGKYSRDKGARGERELFSLLQDELGITIKRNLSQTQDGGADTTDLPGFSLEVKNHKETTLGSREKWWQQTLEQSDSDNKPVLAYRLSGYAKEKAWRFVMAAHDSLDFSYTVEMSLPMFCLMYRETMR